MGQARRRAGRKRKTGVTRLSTGRIRRAGTREREGEARKVALSARRRLFGVSAEDALKAEAGTVVGRLLMSGEIKPWQHQAALEYEAVVRAANAAYLSRRLASAGDLDGAGRGGGHAAAGPGGEGSDPAYVARCRAAIERANRCHRALAGCGELMARYAVDRIVLENLSLPRAVGELRIGLNALCREFRIKVPPGAG